jgi:hypothetical protein
MGVSLQVRRAGQALGQGLNTALARGARSYASPALSQDGFVIEPGFLDADTARKILDDVARFGDRSVKQTGVDGAKLRDRADRQTIDLNVRQLTGAQHLSPGIDDLVTSGRVEHTMSELAGFRLALGGMTVQIDWPDTRTKRGLHVDSHWPPTYKCFVYLTDVTSPGNGPLSVVPGSHRHRIKKVKAIGGNYRAGRKPTDLHEEYRLEDARCLTGPSGTAIFADQRLAHAGWPGHTEGTRFMIVAYLYRPDVDVPGFLG